VTIEKVLKGASPELKFEMSVRALTQATEVLVLVSIRLSEQLDRLEKFLDRTEAQGWEKAINAELKRREKEGASFR
jgi:hypothetical protein